MKLSNRSDVYKAISSVFYIECNFPECRANSFAGCLIDEICEYLKNNKQDIIDEELNEIDFNKAVRYAILDVLKEDFFEKSIYW